MAEKKAFIVMPLAPGQPLPPVQTEKLTFNSYLETIDEVIAILDGEIDNLSSGDKCRVKMLRSARKLLRKTKSSSYKIVGQKKPRGEGKGGFSKGYSVSDELTEFLQLEPGTHVSRIDATRAICVYAYLRPEENREQMLKWAFLNENNRDLQDPKNKRAIIPDEKLRVLLRYDEYAQNVRDGKITKTMAGGRVVTVTDPLLYYWVIQKLLQSHF